MDLIRIKVSSDSVILEWGLPGSTPAPYTGKIRLDEVRKKELFDIHQQLYLLPPEKQRENPPDLTALGTKLAETLFVDGLGAQFLQAVTGLRPPQEENDEPIHVNLEFYGAPDLAILPWEMMELVEAGATRVKFAARPDIVFCRNFGPRGSMRIRTVSRGELLRVALVVAAPQNPASEELWKKYGDVLYKPTLNYLKTLHRDKKIDLVNNGKPFLSASVTTIRAALDENPHILHFIGHGVLDEDESCVVLVSDDARKDPNEIGAQSFANLFKTVAKPPVVFMQSCLSAAPSAATGSSVAYELLAANVPVVIAMQYEITNATASALSTAFYDELVEKRKPLDLALHQVRLSLYGDDQNTHGKNGASSGRYAIPVLFTDLIDCRVFCDERNVTYDDVRDTLFSLNYKAQRRVFADAFNTLKQNRIGALLISGAHLTGQLWLLNQLLTQNDMYDGKERLIAVNFQRLGQLNDITPFWIEIAVQLGITKIPETLDAAFKDRCRNSIVTDRKLCPQIILLDHVESIAAPELWLLDSIIQEFWVPLAEAALKRGKSDYWLLLLLLDHGDRNQCAISVDHKLFAHNGQPIQSVVPLRLPELDKEFDLDLLVDWMQDSITAKNLLHRYLRQNGDTYDDAKQLLLLGKQPERVLDQIYRKVSRKMQGHEQWLPIKTG